MTADEALDPGQNLRPGSQITETRKPSDKLLCLVDFNHLPVVVSWLRSCNAAWLGPIKDNTSFERWPSPGRKEPRRKTCSERRRLWCMAVLGSLLIEVITINFGNTQHTCVDTNLMVYHQT